MIEAIPGIHRLADTLDDLGGRAMEFAVVLRHWPRIHPTVSALEIARGPLAGEAAQRFLAAQESMTRALREMQGEQ